MRWRTIASTRMRRGTTSYSRRSFAALAKSDRKQPASTTRTSQRCWMRVKGRPRRTTFRTCPKTPSRNQATSGSSASIGSCAAIVVSLRWLLTQGGGALADLLWTDPPYNVSYVGKTKDALTIENDTMADGDFRQFLVDAFSAASTGMRDGAVFYVAHADSEGLNFRGSVLDVGWKLAQCLIWVKDRFVMGRQDYHWRHEPILYGWKLGAGHRMLEDRTQDTVWEIPRPARNAQHPTMKPLALIDRAIRNSSNRGDLVLDTFAGSGSSLIACEAAGRWCAAVELDPAYCDVIVERWENATGGKASRAS